jgi:hypothetical protein
VNTTNSGSHRQTPVKAGLNLQALFSKSSMVHVVLGGLAVRGFKAGRERQIFMGDKNP